MDPNMGKGNLMKSPEIPDFSQPPSFLHRSGFLLFPPFSTAKHVARFSALAACQPCVFLEGVEKQPCSTNKMGGYFFCKNKLFIKITGVFDHDDMTHYISSLHMTHYDIILIIVG